MYYGCFLQLLAHSPFHWTPFLPQFTKVHPAQGWIHLTQEPSELGTRNIYIMDHPMSTGTIRTNSEILGEHIENKSWRILVWLCCYSWAEWRSVSVTVALVFISKASVFKMKIKKWDCLFIISYQFYLAFYGICKLCFGFDVIYKNMIKMCFFSVYFILPCMIRWHAWIEKPYSLINSPILSITALEEMGFIQTVR